MSTRPGGAECPGAPQRPAGTGIRRWRGCSPALPGSPGRAVAPGGATRSPVTGDRRRSPTRWPGPVAARHPGPNRRPRLLRVGAGRFRAWFPDLAWRARTPPLPGSPAPRARPPGPGRGRCRGSEWQPGRGRWSPEALCYPGRPRCPGMMPRPGGGGCRWTGPAGRIRRRTRIPQLVRGDGQYVRAGHCGAQLARRVGCPAGRRPRYPGSPCRERTVLRCRSRADRQFGRLGGGYGARFDRYYERPVSFLDVHVCSHARGARSARLVTRRRMRRTPSPGTAAEHVAPPGRGTRLGPTTTKAYHRAHIQPQGRRHPSSVARH